MTLRVSLVIDGNATGAKKAAEDTSRAIGGLAGQTKGLSGTQVDNAAAAARQAQAHRQAAGAIDGANASTGSLRSTFKALAREAAVIGGPLGGLIAQTGALTVGTSKLGAAISVGVVSLAAVALTTYKAIAAFSALEDHQAKVAAALLVTKNASGQTVAGLASVTDQLAANGTQAIDDIRAAEIELLKYKAVGADAFGAVLLAAKGVAATGFADLKTATAALGAALKNPTQASEALAAVGLKLSVVEQRLASDLFAAGKAAEAKGIILKAVSDQVAGADAKAADTLGAAWTRVTNSGKGLLEQWGEQINRGGILKDVLNGIADAAERARNPTQITPQQREDAGPFLPLTMGGVIRMREAQRQRANAPAPPQPQPAGDNFNDRFDTAGINAVSKGVQQRYQDLKDQAERIAKVNDLLTEQARTAGMTAVQQEAYNLAVKAGIVGDKDAAAAIAGKVNAIHALNDTRGIIDAIRGQTAAQVAEAASLGMTGAAAAAYRMEQEKLTAERIKGVSLSSAQLAAIRGEAQAYEAAAGKLALLNLQKSVQFERDQLARSTSEQEVMSRLNAAGLLQNGQIASTTAEAAAQQIRLNQQLKLGIDLTTEFVSGFSKDFKNAIKDGASAFDALKTAGLNALDRLSDKLIDMAAQKLVANAFGTGGVNLLGSLFGGATGAVSSITAGGSSVGNAASLIGRAGGGILDGPGTGTSDSILLRGSRGEFMVNADATAKHRGLLEAINSGDIRVPRFAGGGSIGGVPMPPPRWSSSSSTSSGQAASPVVKIYPVAGTTFDEKRNDDGSVELLGRMIDQKLKTYDRGLPDRVAAIRADPRAR